MKRISVSLCHLVAGVAAQAGPAPEAVRSALNKLMFGFAPGDRPAQVLYPRLNQAGIEG